MESKCGFIYWKAYNCGLSGYIGLDKRYQFKEHIRNHDLSKIAVDPTDIYVDLTLVKDTMQIPLITKNIRFFNWFLDWLGVLGLQKSSIASTYTLPSTLFKTAKEGSKVLFYLGMQPIELTLRQKKHPNAPSEFEMALLQLKASIELRANKYLFAEDYRKQDAYLAEPTPGASLLLSIHKKMGEKKHFHFYFRQEYEQTYYLPKEGDERSLSITLEAPGFALPDFEIKVEKNEILVLGKRDTKDLSFYQKFYKMIDPKKTKIKEIKHGLAQLEIGFLNDN